MERLPGRVTPNAALRGFDSDAPRRRRTRATPQLAPRPPLSILRSKAPRAASTSASWGARSRTSCAPRSSRRRTSELIFECPRGTYLGPPTTSPSRSSASASPSHPQPRRAVAAVGDVPAGAPPASGDGARRWCSSRLLIPAPARPSSAGITPTPPRPLAPHGFAPHPARRGRRPASVSPSTATRCSATGPPCSSTTSACPAASVTEPRGRSPRRAPRGVHTVRVPSPTPFDDAGGAVRSELDTEALPSP